MHQSLFSEDPYMSVNQFEPRITGFTLTSFSEPTLMAGSHSPVFLRYVTKAYVQVTGTYVPHIKRGYKFKSLARNIRDADVSMTYP